MHRFIYSLKLINGRPTLSIDLIGNIVFENPEYTHLKFGDKLIELTNYEWLNRMKVYDDKVNPFFILCTKKISKQYAFDTLMLHAIKNLKSRKENIEKMIEAYESELIQAA